MPHDLDLTLLRTFVVAAERSSMTAAGNALHVTQGAVSQQIARLESALDCALFIRSRRGLRLTPHGERLIGRARAMLSLNDEIWADMTENTVTGAVRLGAPNDLVGTILAHALKNFAERCPDVELTLLSGSSPELAQALARGDLDVAVLEEPTGHTPGECLMTDQLVWVGARGGTAHRTRPLPVSMVSTTCAFRPAVLTALRTGGTDWRTMFENGTIEATAATVRMDMAVTPMLASTVPQDLAVLDHHAALPPLPSFAVNLHLPDTGPSPTAHELATRLREAIPHRRG
ncbi:LysR substrate-binding domain-containing protein [Streptomyces sp. NEAU-YJ-81]|uniref:LysR family transcriptional regulator n=1 Tax=Streptomyces sp. NEAU-YJ-81 TaxID=2820288 RepID=UPI001ABBECD3|nr:LysR substrate-binding domain-containing protein [Streptomyces sp. NEAU-YJ-81]MBO3681370.1 LysR family transcriptional regulator [Streptomyces sp. NEAU-YJ-81]